MRERKEYRLSLNLSNPQHQFIEESISRRCKGETAARQVIIECLYDYFKNGGGCGDLKTYIEDRFAELSRQISQLGGDRGDLDEKNEFRIKEEPVGGARDKTEISQADQRASDKESSKIKEDKTEEAGETELSPGVLNFMQGFNL